MIIFKEEKSVAFCAGCNQEDLLYIYKSQTEGGVKYNHHDCIIWNEHND